MISLWKAVEDLLFLPNTPNLKAQERTSIQQASVHSPLHGLKSGDLAMGVIAVGTVFVGRQSCTPSTQCYAGIQHGACEPYLRTPQETLRRRIYGWF